MPTEFQGLTAEEAVQRARIVLGSDAPVRCWKTRRGGVLGFFSKEIFVAGVSEPAGALKASKSERSIKSNAGGQWFDDATLDVREFAGPEPQPMLADLVAATRDELTVDGVLVSEAAFIDVLAEAEAALVDRVEIAERVLDVNSERVLDALGVRPVANESRVAEQLLDALVTFGVPSEFRPDETVLTLDGVTRALDKLPVPATLPTAEGSLIVVVGSRRDALLVAKRLIENLELTDADLIVFEDTATCRQRVTRRRSSKRLSVLVLEASPRNRELGESATRLENLRPDYVVGAIPATLKRTDVDHWRIQLGRVDALALSRWSATASPAELMGTLPIMFVDGRRASTIRWMILLLEAVEGREP
ncbi:MAG TPA: hypothetical protein VGZ04_06175 [Acidimicrobiales bacterium]|jgi:hypothetical protein|nr:hypothetical protein [Acidimicrobiales bacterium]